MKNILVELQKSTFEGKFYREVQPLSGLEPYTFTTPGFHPGLSKLIPFGDLNPARLKVLDFEM